MTTYRRWVLCACALIVAAGCKSGSSQSTAGQSPANSATNAAPTISGIAKASTRANEAFEFLPTARDPDGDALRFLIQNKPTWATFDTRTGRLAGTPSSAQSGAYADIVISVSDGNTTASLPAFTLTVRSPSSASRSVTLAWLAPTQNTDGSSVTDLGGFVIAYGTSSGALSQMVRIDNPSVDQYVLDDLAPGTYYFGIKAFDTAGAESDLSAIMSKEID